MKLLYIFIFCVIENMYFGVIVASLILIGVIYCWLKSEQKKWKIRESERIEFDRQCTMSNAGTYVVRIN